MWGIIAIHGVRYRKVKILMLIATAIATEIETAIPIAIVMYTRSPEAEIAFESNTCWCSELVGMNTVAQAHLTSC